MAKFLTFLCDQVSKTDTDTDYRNPRNVIYPENYPYFNNSLYLVSHLNSIDTVTKVNMEVLFIHYSSGKEREIIVPRKEVIIPIKDKEPNSLSFHIHLQNFQVASQGQLVVEFDYLEDKEGSLHRSFSIESINFE